jgi:hypothetical protein
MAVLRTAWFSLTLLSLEHTGTQSQQLTWDLDISLDENGTIQGSNGNGLHLHRHYVAYSYIRVYHCGRVVIASGSCSDLQPEIGYLD